MPIAVATVLALSATSALANPPYDPNHNWQGFYGGLYGAGVWGDVDYQSTEFPFSDEIGLSSSSNSVDLDGTLIGILTGYDWQRGSFVFGIVGDAGVMFGGSDPFFESKASDQYKINMRIWNEADLRYLATLRAKAGFLLKDGLLAYGTVGGAMGWFETRVGIDIDGVSEGTASDTFKEFGLAYGGGLQYALGPSTTVQFEYLHVDFDDISVNYIDQVESNFDVDLDQVRLGLTFKFGGFHEPVTTLK